MNPNRPPRSPSKAQSGAKHPYATALRVTLIPLLLVFGALNAAADTMQTQSGTLPLGAHGLSAVSNGQYVFAFGGDTTSGLSAQILRYDPVADVTPTQVATLPSARTLTSAGWDGLNAYVFGGCTGVSCGTYLSEIVRFNPTTNAVTTMTAHLPAGRYGTSVVWSGQYFFVFGGGCGGCAVADIVRYDPSTDTATTMSATLPTAVSYTSAVFDGAAAYIFGGYNGWSFVSSIQKYDPLTNTASTVSATLPSAAYRTSAAWSGIYGYIFGGETCTGCGNLDTVLRWDPVAGTLSTLAATLPTTRSLAAAAWDAAGSRAFILGGNDASNTKLSQILKYTPDPLVPSAPRTLAASASTGQITLTWQAPTSSGGGTITGYKVYGGATSGSETLVTSGGCSSLGNVLTCTESGLGNGVTRYYRVSAVNSVGEGPQSNEASATTPVDPPSAPQALIAVAGSGVNQITLSWQVPLSNGGSPITGYKVYSNPGTGWTYVATTTSLTYTDSGLSPTGSYHYYVSATNVGGEGPASNLACARPYPVGLATSC
ncbi:MAG: hypothetical protein QOG31_1284 [Thermoplasmata archaeon]|jgi:hypothetical protein|nr:hypothetical protein [Thermoplasmata archaeon]